MAKQSKQPVDNQITILKQNPEQVNYENHKIILAMITYSTVQIVTLN